MRFFRLILTVILTLIFIRTSPSTIPEKIVIQEQVPSVEKDYRATILTILCEAGISDDLAFTILAQAQHESGNFCSNIFIENNNCFGMKRPKIRPTLSTGSNRGHAVYNSVEDCVYDYLLWMDHFNIPKDCTTKQYIFLLKKKHYFSDDVNRYYKAVNKLKMG